MILIYACGNLTFALTGSHSGAAFLTDDNGAAMNDGRTGLVSTMSYIGGTQTTASYLEIDVTIASSFDATAAQGGIGVCNVQGLPEGTLLEIAGIQQRLTYDQTGELCAWVLPFATGNTFSVKIYNDVHGTASIAAGTPFGTGEIVAGRVMSIPMLANDSKQPSGGQKDNTAWTQLDGGQNYSLLRKPMPTVTTPLGVFSTADYSGGSTSSLSSGANPAGKIDLKRLMNILSVAPVVAICDTPSAGQGAGAVSHGIRFDQAYMQSNFMLARPISLPDVVMDTPPKWSWSPQWQKAT